jgi:hypothetical protein
MLTFFFFNVDNTSPWSVIPEHRKYGHSEQQLQTLLDTAAATPATITALLHAAPTATFYTQLAAVLHQSSPPSTVWLVCDSTHDQTALQQHIQALPVEKTTTVHVLLSQHTTSKKKDDDSEAAWMMFALQADSDYIWILERDSVPGERYLERLVRLSSTPAYKHTLLGTLGYDEQDQCIESTGADFVTRPAHRLGGGLWLLHRSWLALDLFRPLVSQDRGRVVSSYLNHIGVTPIVLPLSHPSQSHDATQATPLAACSSVPPSPPPTTTATPSLVFLVDQAEQFQELMPLICHHHRGGAAASLDKPIIHVLSTQVSSLSTLQAMLFEHDPKCQASSSLVLHPLSDWLLTYPQHEQQAWQLAQTLLHQLPLTMARLNATVLIHTRSNTPRSRRFDYPPETSSMSNGSWIFLWWPWKVSDQYVCHLATDVVRIIIIRLAYRQDPACGNDGSESLRLDPPPSLGNQGTLHGRCSRSDHHHGSKQRPCDTAVCQRL